MLMSELYGWLSQTLGWLKEIRYKLVRMCMLSLGLCEVQQQAGQGNCDIFNPGRSSGEAFLAMRTYSNLADSWD